MPEDSRNCGCNNGNVFSNLLGGGCSCGNDTEILFFIIIFLLLFTSFGCCCNNR